MPASQVYGIRCLRPGFFGRRASVGCAHTPHASRMTYDVFFARRALEYCVVDLSCPVPQTRILRPEGPRILDLGG